MAPLSLTEEALQKRGQIEPKDPRLGTLEWNLRSMPVPGCGSRGLGLGDGQNYVCRVWQIINHPESICKTGYNSHLLRWLLASPR